MKFTVMDASNICLGAVLSQLERDGLLHSVVFVSLKIATQRETYVQHRERVPSNCLGHKQNKILFMGSKM